MTPVGFRLPPPITPIWLRLDVEKRPQALHPLAEKLAAMDQDERVALPLGDQCGGHDRLAERRRGGEDAVVVEQEVRKGPCAVAAATLPGTTRPPGSG